MRGVLSPRWGRREGAMVLEGDWKVLHQIAAASYVTSCDHPVCSSPTPYAAASMVATRRFIASMASSHSRTRPLLMSCTTVAIIS